jgi:aquaporin Z
MMEAGAPRPHPVHQGLHPRIWAAEALGTALLVLGALSAVALALSDESPAAGIAASASFRLLVAGLLVGATVAVIAVSPVGRLSGGHLNPAVTLAFAVLGRVGARDVVGYLVAQFAGALMGALAFHLVWGQVAVSVGGGVTHPTVAASWALILEAAMTGLLVATILFFLSRERLAHWTPVAVWALLAVLIWKASGYTGTSLNPARSEGPAVAFSDTSDLWLYIVAPVAGSLAVATAWRRLNASMHPKTAKLFHDRRYACAFSTDIPAMAPGAPTRRSSGGRPADLPPYRWI